MEWIDMQTTNKDMEFNQWLEFLFVMFCAMYTIDPTELGFNFKMASTVFGQDGQKERLEHSKEKGLKPLLIFLQKIFNKYLVSEIDPEMEFVFTGIDLEDQKSAIEIDKMKLDAGVVSWADMFEKYSQRKPGEDEIILNPVYLQYKQMQQYGGDMNQEVDAQNPGSEGEGAQNPFDQYEEKNPFDQFAENADENPITKAALDYIGKSFGNDKLSSR